MAGDNPANAGYRYQKLNRFPQFRFLAAEAANLPLSTGGLQNAQTPEPPAGWPA
jgi:hypothetical protein